MFWNSYLLQIYTDIFNFILLTTISLLEQLKKEHYEHNLLISRLENYLEYNKLSTNKLNQILHQSGELSPKYLLRRTNERSDGPNAAKFKIIPADYATKRPKTSAKQNIELCIQVLNHIVDKLNIGDEIVYLLN